MSARDSWDWMEAGWIAVALAFVGLFITLTVVGLDRMKADDAAKHEDLRQCMARLEALDPDYGLDPTSTGLRNCRQAVYGDAVGGQ